MWGEPRTKYEVELAEDVAQLRSFWADNRSPFCAVGSIWSPRYHRLMPFIVIKAEFRERRQMTGKLFEVSDEGRFPRTRLPLHAMILQHPQPARGLGHEVERVAGWIDDYVRVREPLICASTGRRGSGAILVIDNSTMSFGLLTAGHVFDRVSLLVEQERVRALFFSRRTPLGRVSHCIVPPKGAAGYDAAVVQLHTPLESRATVAVNLRERFIAPEPIIVHGAVSGFVSRAAVMGQLVEVDYGPARWLNCWMVAPSGMLRSGDSGSAVFTRKDRALLGLYVGSSGYPARPLFHYVQDGWSLQQNVLNRWNVSY